MVPLLMLVPYLFQKTVIQDAVSLPQDDFSCHFFQIPPEPKAKRYGEPLLLTIQDVIRKLGLEGLL